MRVQYGGAVGHFRRGLSDDGDRSGDGIDGLRVKGFAGGLSECGLASLRQRLSFRGNVERTLICRGDTRIQLRQTEFSEFAGIEVPLNADSTHRTTGDEHGRHRRNGDESGGNDSHPDSVPAQAMKSRRLFTVGNL